MKPTPSDLVRVPARRPRLVTTLAALYLIAGVMIGWPELQHAYGSSPSHANLGGVPLDSDAAFLFNCARSVVLLYAGASLWRMRRRGLLVAIVFEAFVLANLGVTQAVRLAHGQASIVGWMHHALNASITVLVLWCLLLSTPAFLKRRKRYVFKVEETQI